MGALTEFYFTKKELGQVHPAHLSYLIAAAHACNELNAIRIYLIFERSDVKEKTAERPFVTIRQMVLLRHLAGKLFEFNKITIKYFGQIKTSFPHKQKAYQAKYLPIAQRLRKYRWLDQLRNKMAFHFDDQAYLEQFRSIVDDQELSMMVGNKQGETAFLFAEEIVSMPYFAKVGNGNVRKGLEETADFANKATSEVLEFFSQFHIDIARQYGLFKNKRFYDPNPAATGVYGEDFIPVFTSDSLRLRTRDQSGAFIDDAEET